MGWETSHYNAWSQTKISQYFTFQQCQVSLHTETGGGAGVCTSNLAFSPLIELA